MATKKKESIATATAEGKAEVAAQSNVDWRDEIISNWTDMPRGIAFKSPEGFPVECVFFGNFDGKHNEYTWHCRSIDWMASETLMSPEVRAPEVQARECLRCLMRKVLEQYADEIAESVSFGW